MLQLSILIFSVSFKCMRVLWNSTNVLIFTIINSWTIFTLFLVLFLVCERVHDELKMPFASASCVFCEGNGGKKRRESFSKQRLSWKRSRERFKASPNCRVSLTNNRHTNVESQKPHFQVHVRHFFVVYQLISFCGDNEKNRRKLNAEAPA
jgi:hypothetical protein